MPSSPTAEHPDSPRATAGSLSVAIVDDHPPIREALQRAIEKRMGMEVVAEAGSNEDAFRLIKEYGPDVAIIDLSLNDGLSFGLIEALHAECPETDLLVFSMHGEDVYAERVLRGGASGYVMKPTGTKEVLKAIEKVGYGEVYLSPEMTIRVRGRTVKGHGKELRFPIDELTGKELEVFKMVGRGMGIDEIANELGLTRKTIEAHRRKVKEKLGYETVHEVTAHAARWVQSEARTDQA
jgi:DNA-binding NarL/FixJ family response regulator